MFDRLRQGLYSRDNKGSNVQQDERLLMFYSGFSDMRSGPRWQKLPSLLPETLELLEQDLISTSFDNSNGSLGKVVQPYDNIWVDIEKSECIDLSPGVATASVSLSVNIVFLFCNFVSDFVL